MNFKRLLSIACNSKAVKNLIAIACNRTPINTATEWQLISPYGVFAHPLGRQRIQQAEAGKIVKALNEQKTQSGSAWRGVPIFIGHPPSRGGAKTQAGPFPRIGAVLEAEARPDGLWGKIAWNDLGTQNAENGHYIYPSPGWFFTKDNDGSIRPCELDHIGMTNEPNINESAPWTNDKNNSDNPDQPETPPLENMKPICEALGLAETATEEEILNAIMALKSDKDTAAAAVVEKEQAAMNEKTQREAAELIVTNERESKTKAENDLKAARDAHAKTLLDIAINEGRITLAQRPAHEAAFAADFTVATNALAAIKPQRDTKPVSLELHGARKSIATNAERQEIIRVSVNERMEKHKEAYPVAFAAVKKDPAYKGVFDAMEQPKAQG